MVVMCPRQQNLVFYDSEVPPESGFWRPSLLAPRSFLPRVAPPFFAPPCSLASLLAPRSFLPSALLSRLAPPFFAPPCSLASLLAPRSLPRCLLGRWFGHRFERWLCRPRAAQSPPGSNVLGARLPECCLLAGRFWGRMPTGDPASELLVGFSLGSVLAAVSDFQKRHVGRTALPPQGCPTFTEGKLL